MSKLLSKYLRYFEEKHRKGTLQSRITPKWNYYLKFQKKKADQANTPYTEICYPHHT